MQRATLSIVCLASCRDVPQFSIYEERPCVSAQLEPAKPSVRDNVCVDVDDTLAHGIALLHEDTYDPACRGRRRDAVGSFSGSLYQISPARDNDERRLRISLSARWLLSERDKGNTAIPESRRHQSTAWHENHIEHRWHGSLREMPHVRGLTDRQGDLTDRLAAARPTSKNDVVARQPERARIA